MNIDFAPLFLDYAGLQKPSQMQGESFRKNLTGERPGRKSMYYRYWMNADDSHNVPALYGIRTDRYKLIFYYALPLGMKGTNEMSLIPEWELYDLKEDPMEMKNIYHDAGNENLIKELKTELLKLKKQYGDEDGNYPEMKELVSEYYW